MVISGLRRRPATCFLGLACAVVGAAWGIASSARFRLNPGVLSQALAVDLVLVIPIAYWLLVVRGRVARGLTAIPVAALMIVFASAIIPAGQVRALTWAQYLIGPAEIGLLAYIAYKILGLFAASDVDDTDDVYERARALLQDALGNAFAARLIASEFAVFYYAFAFGGRSRTADIEGRTFEPARAGTVLAALIPIVVLETAGVHLLLARWSVSAAWTLTGLSAYTVLWVWGDFRAMRLRPTMVTRDELVLRVGMRCCARVPLAMVERLEATDWRDAGRARDAHLNVAGLDGPNVLVVFREPMLVQRMFGLQIRARSVSLRIWDAGGLIVAVGRERG